MLTIRRAHFSLIEVLICLLLISVTIPLLTAPFYYASLDQQETVEQVVLEQAGQSALANIMQELQFKRLMLVESDMDSMAPINTEWLKSADRGYQIEGIYSFKKLKPKGEDEGGAPVELWQVAIGLKRSNQKNYTPFVYEFVVTKQPEPGATATPEGAKPEAAKEDKLQKMRQQE